MTWLGWVLCFMFAINSCLTTSMVGKRRDVITPGVAVFSIILNSLFIIGIVTVGTGTL